ncbi:hypothetical protein Acr_00g0103130 [Actinidia rufa]|uniref:NB-ARC domain-containing disease resistance protein n=1 Tax=Actinidia rufa TaxID=165716 RepID=A0A7J0E0U9_9ERIC|nr:hypothetical protein Acr_00g0103130 [Actinidia rufa]
MAETILFNIASKVLEELGSLALREVGLAWGLDDELKSLEGTLRMIKAVVLAVDGAKRQQREMDHPLLNIWLKRLQDAFYHADNVLDEFHYQALRRQVLRNSGWSIQAKVQEFLLCSSMSPLVFRSRMGPNIRNITDRLHRIAEDRVIFCVMMPGGRSNDEQGFSSMSTSVNELDFVGRANDKEAILSLLTTSSVDEKLSVIPIVGRGGLGKTTLVKLVYNSERCNSDSPCDNLDDKTKLRTLFQDKLNGRRFLLVLDDVSHCENQDWVRFCQFLRGSAHGSCEKVGEQHVKLAEIASEIVKKCHGYPLAAKTLGSLLFMKTDENEWLYLKDRELWELAQNKRDILPVLKLSYDTLPADMKRCFLYCSLFPKCYEIKVDKLIQLWMAEGFIQSYINHELEDAGAEYVNHLCSINFLEKIRDQCGNLSNKCRMPEIIHDLAVFIAEKECKGIASYRSGIVIPEEVKHVSIHDSDCSREEVTNSLFMLMNLRSVLYFPSQGAGANEESFIERCISRFKYLRVLDLSDSCFPVLPRYVDFANMVLQEIQKLPQNLGNLISLRHLYLTTQQSCLPEKQIQRLTSLRTLGIEGCGNLKSLPEGIQLLTALTTVTIATCPKLTSLPSSMKNMAKLRNLEISKCPNLNLSGWEHFKGLKRLH